MLHFSVPDSKVVFVEFLIFSNILNLFLQVACDNRLNIFPPVSHNPNDISFYLFLPPAGSSNVEDIKFLSDVSLSQSHFIPNILTVIFIHGYDDDVFGKKTAFPLMNAYLSSGIRGNFIGVKWDKLSTTISTQTNPLQVIPGYLEVLPNIPIVGERVGEFITWLVGKDVLRLDQLHIIGHSLGAHITGYAGDAVQRLGNGERVRRITGLDPAGPLLEGLIKLERVLSSNDANFVDIIHTSAGLFGTVELDGDVDIYVNNGVVQPGCVNFNVIACSHEFAVRVYIASFTRPETACKCPSLRFGGSCKDPNGPCIDPTWVGVYIPESTRGVFQLYTSANPEQDFLLIN